MLTATCLPSKQNLRVRIPHRVPCLISSMARAAVLHPARSWFDSSIGHHGLVAQWTEQWSSKPCARVRLLPGLPCWGSLMKALALSGQKMWVSNPAPRSFPLSFNGRTSGCYPLNLGSNPSEGANNKCGSAMIRSGWRL